MKRLLRALLALAGSAAAASAVAAGPAARLLDGFDTLTAWQASGTDQVDARLEAAKGSRGKAMCLAYDFHGVSGYVVARRTLQLALPAHYAFTFNVRGEGPANDFQVKFVDASGDNVWWLNKTGFAPPAQWQPFKLRQRQIDFAWGPTTDKVLERAAAVEFVVASGQGPSSGGKGRVCVDEFTLHTLAPEAGPPPALRALGTAPNAALAVDGDAASAWTADARRPQALTIDLGRPREFGGLVLRWQPDAHATRYAVQLSDDGKRWTTARQVSGAGRSVQPLLLTESEARYIRLQLQQGAGARYALAEVELKDLAWGASRNSFLLAEAREQPRGHYPRGFRGEQPYWTVVGVDGGAAHSALFGEDGAVEVGKNGFSIEPFVVDAQGTVTTWADVSVTQSLQEGYLPIPSAHWRHPRWQLDTTVAALGTPAQSQLLMRYRLANTTDQPQQLTLALAVRPLQVNPATQFLNASGGAATLRSLARSTTLQGEAVTVEGQPRVWPLQPADDAVGTSFDGASLVAMLNQPPAPRPLAVHDEFGAASAALRWRLSLAPGESRTIELLAPLTGLLPAHADSGWAAQQLAATTDAWRARLNRVGLQLPKAAQPLADTLRSAHAQMLVSRDGPMLQPGTRSYARAWVRDGAMMAEGLLRLGDVAVAREFVRWYAPHQFRNGKVPCCVDKRGADPVPENDSHGQLIFAIAELYRHTGDLAELRQLWPHVDAAVRYMDQLRASERTEANRQGAQRAHYGLMPASISHEGYSAKPMHSYWDDFWALRGYKDAVQLAQALGDAAAAQRIATARDEFAHDLHASIRTAAELHKIDFIPGAAELGDFDATSTTIGLAPGGEQHRLLPAQLAATFERYWREFVERREGRKTWADYTPYELRNVGALLRLGRPDRAHEALRFFMADRRPAAWNQWAEVVGREAREPRFIGDMPHAWISSDYIRALLDLLAYEREQDASLVLAAGVPPAWLDEGVLLRQLATAHGPLGYRLQRVNGELQLDVEAGLRLPAGGLVFTWPGEGEPPPATVDGTPQAWQGHELRLQRLPAKVRMPMP